MATLLIFNLKMILFRMIVVIIEDNFSCVFYLFALFFICQIGFHIIYAFFCRWRCACWATHLVCVFVCCAWLNVVARTLIVSFLMTCQPAGPRSASLQRMTDTTMPLCLNAMLFMIDYCLLYI